ncbi:hypothetical protein EML15_02025 [Corynebacterium sp. sy017]|uniref:hypothetical protein n=1 Tax=unclassified Corynebacterium TaxID=2624378 RepID=UPI001186DDED|nr:MULTISPECIES: hypothetical protein [unclassified Corynebacterium]MBP3087935.1 hypothetical protein [Corynebacterium sp. sy017]QDZ42898.1 hypothetical protein FQV43_06770 [Corynebacterium sp. sy039]TSD92471.1 hypothetical protein ELY17_02025 [Corynebacterium sp. SY003]
MSLQHRPNNPIELRKQAVRRNAAKALICVGGGVVGGLSLGFLLASQTLMVLGFVIAVVGGAFYANKVRSIINQRDNY